MDRVQQIFQESGINKVMVDTTKQESMPSIVSVYSLFSKHSRDIKAALLVKEFQSTEKDQYFAETVSANRGINVNVFHSQEEFIVAQ